jgi:hypothetical protein
MLIQALSKSNKRHTEYAELYSGKEVKVMPKCGICGGEAPKQPCITEEGKCDICVKKVTLAVEKKK